MSGGQVQATGGLVDQFRVRSWLAFAIIGLFGFLEASVTAPSVVDDYAAMGHQIDPWRPWAWELTSLAGWLAMLPFIMVAVARLRPPRFGWPTAITLHLAITIPISLGHVGVMTGLRHLVYAAQGLTYRLRTDVLDDLLYEYRKDVFDYALAAVIFLILDRLLRAASEPTSSTAEVPTLIEVRDGSRTTWLAPPDIMWAEAAGNYVELHTIGGTLLHRTTLAALEADLLPHGFVRIHRARLVQRQMVRSVQINVSGDFEAVLTNGVTLNGSRRYRAALGTKSPVA